MRRAKGGASLRPSLRPSSSSRQFPPHLFEKVNVSIRTRPPYVVPRFWFAFVYGRQTSSLQRRPRLFREGVCNEAGSTPLFPASPNRPVDHRTYVRHTFNDAHPSNFYCPSIFREFPTYRRSRDSHTDQFPFVFNRHSESASVPRETSAMAMMHRYEIIRFPQRNWHQLETNLRALQNIGLSRQKRPLGKIPGQITQPPPFFLTAYLVRVQISCG